MFCAEAANVTIPPVIHAFHEAVTGIVATPAELLEETGVATSQLKPGMIVTRDLIAKDGFLLLSTDHVLDERLIRLIIAFEATADI